jgi:flagellar protein FlaI
MDGASKEYASYELDANGLIVDVKIKDSEDEFVPLYEITVPGVGDATKVLLLSLRQEMLSLVAIDPNRVQDKEYMVELAKKYSEASNLMIDKYLPGTPSTVKKSLTAYLINIMLGLGDLEPPLADSDLEEIAVNSSKEFIWVFHKKFGWCKTNIRLRDESLVYDSAQQIGRRVGREISNITPLMDAELSDGSRVNATLFPISQRGNTLTIRKFSKNPWSMTALVANHTVSKEIASLVWLSVQNELSILISGGTASGKTSFLNAISIFMPANRRIISVEETRELTLPDFLQWLPMLTRQANPEGKGEVTLYNLMINALRQRPDIMLIGEIRTRKDAETLFEAVHTGHAVYGTVHADNAQDTIVRMTNPPIDMPKIMLNALGGVVTLFRHRKLGIRRVLEFGEVLSTGDVNVINRWNMRNDTFSQVSDFSRFLETISLYGGYTKNEVDQDIEEKSKIIDWMIKNNLLDVNTCGFIVSNYYKHKEKVLQAVADDAPYSPAMFGKGLATKV